MRFYIKTILNKIDIKKKSIIAILNGTLNFM